MLCSRDERLEDRIVRVVLAAGASKAEDIHQAVASRGNAWSLAATYKALRKLVEGGVLVHSRSRYHVSQNWIFSLSGLIDSSLESPFDSRGGEHLLPDSGGSFLWRYTDLHRLNNFASNVILVAARVEGAEVIYSWSPHLWFNLVQPEHEKHYHDALKRLGCKIQKVVGGDTPLDRETAGHLPKSSVMTRFVPYKQFLPRNHYTIVVGSFVITMKLQRETSDLIDTLFHRGKSIASLDAKLLLRIFRHTKTPATLLVEHNPTKAEQIVKKFEMS